MTDKQPVHGDVQPCTCCAARMNELTKLQAFYKAQNKPMQERAMKSAVQAVRRVAQ